MGKQGAKDAYRSLQVLAKSSFRSDGSDEDGETCWNLIAFLTSTISEKHQKPLVNGAGPQRMKSDLVFTPSHEFLVTIGTVCSNLGVQLEGFSNHKPPWHAGRDENSNLSNLWPVLVPYHRARSTLGAFLQSDRHGPDASALHSSHTAGACDAWVPGADPCRGLFQVPFLHESAAISSSPGVLEVGGSWRTPPTKRQHSLQESTSPPPCYFKHVFVPAPRRRTIG